MRSGSERCVGLEAVLHFVPVLKALLTGSC